ncbi:MAG: FAD-dependent oxidoreductase [Firmicutes bacterium]|nr:FAD-dependent oxidoreductase [Bacillota bacterium]
MANYQHDLVIIGGGPGGLAAAIYGARSKISTVVIEKASPGGQIATTAEWENYPGTPSTSGPEEMKGWVKHAEKFGAEFVKDEVVNIIDQGETKLVVGKNNTFEAKVVIVSVGAEPRVLGVPGEYELRGKGVSYCATCDADFFEELDVVVVGSGDQAIEEGMYITKFAETVTVIVLHEEGTLDCTPVLKERAFSNPKMKWVWNSTVNAIKGDGIVEEVELRNIKTGELSTIEANGIFFFVGMIPQTDWLKGIIDMDDRGYIIANELCETNVDGIYAVGDARQKFLRQVVTAAADGAIAATAAEKFIHEEEGFKDMVINQKVPVIVSFWNPTKPETMDLNTQLEAALEQFGDKIKFVKIDTYRNLRISRKCEVKDIPTVVFYKDGQIVDRLDLKVEVDQVVEKIKGLL